MKGQKSHGKFKGYKVIYFDIMLNGMFVFQFAYKYCPLFALNLSDVMQEVYKLRPSLRTKHIEIYQTEEVLY